MQDTPLLHRASLNSTRAGPGRHPPLTPPQGQRERRSTDPDRTRARFLEPSHSVDDLKSEDTESSRITQVLSVAWPHGISDLLKIEFFLLLDKPFYTVVRPSHTDSEIRLQLFKTLSSLNLSFPRIDVDHTPVKRLAIASALIHSEVIGSCKLYFIAHLLHAKSV